MKHLQSFELFEQSLSESCTIHALLQDMGDFIKVDPNSLELAKKSKITDANNKDFKKLCSDWQKGVYDEDPQQLVSEITGLLRESFNSLNEGEVNYKSDAYALVLVGGSIGSKGSYPIFVGRAMGSIVETSNDKDALVETKKRMNKQLSPGEKSYYGMSYKVIELTNSARKNIDYLIAFQNKPDDAPVVSESYEEIYEGAMADIDIIAQEAKDFKDFVKQFKKSYEAGDLGDEKSLEAWLKTVYDNRSK